MNRESTGEEEKKTVTTTSTVVPILFIALSLFLLYQLTGGGQSSARRRESIVGTKSRSTARSSSDEEDAFTTTPPPQSPKTGKKQREGPMRDVGTDESPEISSSQSSSSSRTRPRVGDATATSPSSSFKGEEELLRIAQLSAAERRKLLQDPSFNPPSIFVPCIKDMKERRLAEALYFEWATLGMTTAERKIQKEKRSATINVPCFPQYSYFDVTIDTTGNSRPNSRDSKSSWIPNQVNMDWTYFDESPWYVPSELPNTPAEQFPCSLLVKENKEDNNNGDDAVENKKRGSSVEKERRAEEGSGGGGGGVSAWDNWKPKSIQLPLFWNTTKEREVVFGGRVNPRRIQKRLSTQLKDIIPLLPERREISDGDTLSSYAAQGLKNFQAQFNKGKPFNSKKLFQVTSTVLGAKDSRGADEDEEGEDNQSTSTATANFATMFYQAFTTTWSLTSPRYLYFIKATGKNLKTGWGVKPSDWFTCLNGDVFWQEGEWLRGPGLLLPSRLKILSEFAAKAVASPSSFEDGGVNEYPPDAPKIHVIRVRHAVMLPEPTCPANMYHGLVETVIPMWDLIMRRGWNPKEVLFLMPNPSRFGWGPNNLGCPPRNTHPFGFHSGKYPWLGKIIFALLDIQSPEEFDQRFIFLAEASKFPRGTVVHADTLTSGFPRMCTPFFPYDYAAADGYLHTRVPYYDGYSQHRYGPYCATLLTSLVRKVFRHFELAEFTPSVAATAREPGLRRQQHEGVVRLLSSTTKASSENEGEDTNRNQDEFFLMPPRLRCFLSGIVIRPKNRGGRAILNRDQVIPALRRIVETEYKRHYADEWIHRNSSICSYKKGMEILAKTKVRGGGGGDSGIFGAGLTAEEAALVGDDDGGKGRKKKGSNSLLPSALTAIKLENYEIADQIRLMQQVGLYVVARGMATVNTMWLPEGSVTILLNIAEEDRPVNRDAHPWNTFHQFLPHRTIIFINCKPVFSKEISTNSIDSSANFFNMECNETAVSNAVKLGLAVLRGASEAKKAVKDGVLKRGPYGSLYYMPKIVEEEGIRSFESLLNATENRGQSVREYYVTDEMYSFNWNP